MIAEPQNIVSRYVQRRALLPSLVLLVLLFLITAALLRTYHAREEGLTEQWFQKGNTELAKGKPVLALDDFRNSLSYGPRNPGVQLRLAEALLADAGQVAYEDGDYLKAETYFSKSDRENPSPEIHASLVLVRDVLGNDPYLAGLSDEEQARRILRDFDLGLERLHNCSGNSGNGSSAPSSVPSPSELQLLNKDAQDLQKRINLPSLSGNPEFRNDAMQFVYRIEDTASRICGPATGLDQALTLIEKRHEGNNL